MKIYTVVKYTLLIFVSLTMVGLACTSRSDVSDWRGPARDGIFPESGLLKEWPEMGPELLWSAEGLGMGHNSVAVTRDRVYATGIRDSAEAMGILSVFDLQGQLLWKKEYGKEFTSSFPGTRSTPVVVDDRIYIESGTGAILCLNTEDGTEIWSKDFLDDFGVDSIIQFGHSESVLIDGDHLFCVPGGKKNNVVALDRFTGELIWSCPGNGEQATYNSPVMIETGTNRLVVAMTAASVMGIDAMTGEMYWRFEQTQANNIHGNTPLFWNGELVVCSPDAKSTSGTVQFRVSSDGKTAEEAWRVTTSRTGFSGIVRVDSCIYGALAGGTWQVLSWKSGEVLAQGKEIKKGSIIRADGMFYCFTERDGVMALVDADPGKFEVISQFTIPYASKQHWARPVIRNGILYVRHGDALMAYDVKAEA